LSKTPSIASRNELKEYAGYIDFLHEILLEELNSYHLTLAKKEVAHPLKNSLFVVEAWVPRNKVNHLFGLIDGLNILAEQIAVPTLKIEFRPAWKIKGLGLIGEDLINSTYPCDK
jgi:hypothetical protein